MGLSPWDWESEDRLRTMGHPPKTEVFCPARQKFDRASLSTARRMSEQPHVPLSTVTFMEVMDVTLNTLSVFLIQEVWGFPCITERK